MNIKVIGAGTSRNKDIESCKALPAFRKATRNMILAQLAIEEALIPFLKKHSKKDLTHFGLVLGSSQGELETTIQFLDYLYKSGVARPLLFQNSLHNSTSGFLGMNFGIQGPSLAVSQHLFTGENVIELASSLLESQQCHSCLAVGVDSIPSQFASTDFSNFKGEGAGALLLTSQSSSSLSTIAPLTPLALLGAIRYSKSTVHGGPQLSSDQLNSHYDSDAIELLVNKIQDHQEAKTGNSNSPVSSIVFPKPNGDWSEVEFQAGVSE